MILLEYDVDRSPARRLPSPGECIYCGATGVQLTEEHVIPFAIGKNATILEGACCAACQKVIQPYEQRVLRNQLGVFRAMVEAPTRKKKDRPKVIKLPLVEISHGAVGRDLGTREIPIAEGPLILNLWRSPPPAILGETVDAAKVDGSSWHFVERERADPFLKKVAKEEGVAGAAIVLPSVNRLDYLRSLAKTAHAYAVAEIGISAFEPFLNEIILNRSDDLSRFVGDMPRAPNFAGQQESSFKISLGQTPLELGDAGGLIAVFMQFWPKLGCPPHLVIVGQPIIDIEAQFFARRAQHDVSEIGT